MTDGINEGRRRGRFGWVVPALVLSVAVGVLSYNAGVADGTSAGAAGAAAGAITRVHWGWGAGPLVWLLLLFTIFAFARASGGWGCGGRRGWYYSDPYGSMPPLDEWHRRAHERMKEDRPADDPDRRG